MTLREEIINLSGESLNEDLVTAIGIGLIALALGLSASAGISIIADKIKSKNWDKTERIEYLEKEAYKRSYKEITTSFDVDKNHLKTYIIPSENFLMKFSRKKAVPAPTLNEIFIIDDFEFKDFLKELKSIIVDRYKQLFERVQINNDKYKDKVKKFLEKNLSVEFYCRGIVALTKEQKQEVEKTIKEAIKEAGVDKFKFKLLSATYK